MESGYFSVSGLKKFHDESAWSFCRPFAGYFEIRDGLSWRDSYSKAVYLWKSWKPGRYLDASDYKAQQIGSQV